MAFWTALAEDQGRALTRRLDPGPLPVALAADDLRDLVDVLIDNVFAHTPEGTALTVERARASERSGGRGRCSSSPTTGPGSRPGSTGQLPTGSTGLGLDIAARTAAAAGGRLDLVSRDSRPRPTTRAEPGCR